jgi:uncharacterized Zn-binding protein involved in type VI secretion
MSGARYAEPSALARAAATGWCREADLLTNNQTGHGNVTHATPSEANQQFHLPLHLQQAILRVGDQEHVFHMAKESHTSALIRLPRSPVHPGAPVTSSAQVTAKLKPQQTLDQGTKERVRALGQEAAAKQKQRAAVMLNGKAAERAATVGQELGHGCHVIANRYSRHASFNACFVCLWVQAHMVARSHSPQCYLCRASLL